MLQHKILGAILQKNSAREYRFLDPNNFIPLLIKFTRITDYNILPSFTNSFPFTIDRFLFSRIAAIPFAQIPSFRSFFPSVSRILGGQKFHPTNPRPFVIVERETMHHNAA